MSDVKKIRITPEDLASDYVWEPVLDSAKDRALAKAEASFLDRLVAAAAGRALGALQVPAAALWTPDASIPFVHGKKKLVFLSELDSLLDATEPATPASDRGCLCWSNGKMPGEHYPRCSAEAPWTDLGSAPRAAFAPGVMENVPPVSPALDPLTDPAKFLAYYGPDARRMDDVAPEPELIACRPCGGSGAVGDTGAVCWRCVGRGLVRRAQDGERAR